MADEAQAYLKNLAFNFGYLGYGVANGKTKVISECWKRLSKRPLIKDPIAIFSLPWMAKVLDSDVIILIRHPAAFVASLIVKDWKFDFNNLLSQSLLMKEMPGPFREKIEIYAKGQVDIINQGILLWNVIYYQVSRYQLDYPDWYFIKHETLSQSPIEEFAKIFEYTSTPFSNRVREGIKEFSEGKSSGELKRNSQENILNWKARLSISEIEAVKIGTREIASLFYSDEDW
ncbi:MAG: hypothetical protein IPH04_13880 [Saprospirales bacterium]|nr:hypothetical protein [Saprospirales bacterium]